MMHPESKSNLNVHSSIGARSSMFIPLSVDELKQIRKHSIQDESCLQAFSDNPSDHSLRVSKKRSTKYQNTYKLEPDKHFPVRQAEDIAEEVLRDHLEDAEYSESSCRKLVKLMSDKILQAVKELNCPRHKIVVLVNLGQLNGQGLRIGSRFLWQPQHDNFAEAIYEGKTLWCTAAVFGVYQD